jgi:hypothetical protein
MNIGWSTQHRSDRKSAVGQELTLGKDRFWRKADVHSGRTSPFHAALAGVGVSAIFHDHAEALHGELTRLVLDDFLRIKVLDGKMIVIVLE